MSYSDRDRAIALAGICQAALLVQQTARRGAVDGDALEATLHSLFQFNAASVGDVFGGTGGVEAGLRELHRQLSGSHRDPEITRYMISLIQLATRLRDDEALQQEIHHGLVNADRLREADGLRASDLTDALAGLYSRTISRITPRIMVHGEPLHLQNPTLVARIRALLLGGVRAAVLWRQTGGKRRQIILRRRQITQTVERLLAQLEG